MPINPSRLRFRLCPDGLWRLTVTFRKPVTLVMDQRGRLWTEKK